MGSPTRVELAYIAGFLDGDGSLMIQIKKRSDSAKGVRIMLTVCFYQDTRHEKPLAWIRKILGIGYLSRRNDGMTELRINGFSQVERVLKALLPFIRFKKIQAQTLLKSVTLLRQTMTAARKQKLAEYILLVQRENYVTRKKRTAQELFQLLGMTP